MSEAPVAVPLPAADPGRGGDDGAAIPSPAGATSALLFGRLDGTGRHCTLR